jgi:hypothetical protein
MRQALMARMQQAAMGGGKPPVQPGAKPAEKPADGKAA